MSMALGFGCLFLSTVHDHSQVRMRFAWAASKLPLMVNRQIADDLAAALEHPPRCDIGRQGCSTASSAALLPTKGVAKQAAAAAGWTDTKPDPKAMSRYPVAWRQAVDDRDYLIRTIAFEASGEPQMAQIAVAYVVLNRKKSGRWGDNIKAVVTHPGQFEPWTTRHTLPQSNNRSGEAWWCTTVMGSWRGTNHRQPHLLLSGRERCLTAATGTDNGRSSFHADAPQGPVRQIRR